LMQDGKALQAGTSHSWGRTLQKPLMKFANAEGKQEYVWELRGVFRRV
jgi:hypothetical protein